MNMPCPWSGCSCRHIECNAGWLDSDASTTPCPTCRPEVAAHLRNPNIPAPRLRQQLPALSRPSREAAKGTADRW